MNNYFPERLRILRSLRRITQKETARRIHLSPGTLSNYENGVHEPDFETLGVLADFYGVSIDYLLGRTPLPSPPAKEDFAIHGKYSVERLLALLPYLTNEDRAFLAYMLSVFERLRVPGRRP